MKTEIILVGGLTLELTSHDYPFNPSVDIRELKGDAYSFKYVGSGSGKRVRTDKLHYAIEAGLHEVGGSGFLHAAANNLLVHNPALCVEFLRDYQSRNSGGLATIEAHHAIEKSQAWVTGRTYQYNEGSLSQHTEFAKAFIDDKGRASIHTMSVRGIDLLRDLSGRDFKKVDEKIARLMDTVDILHKQTNGEAYLQALLHHAASHETADVIKVEVVPYIKAYGISTGSERDLTRRIYR